MFCVIIVWQSELVRNYVYLYFMDWRPEEDCLNWLVPTDPVFLLHVQVQQRKQTAEIIKRWI